MRRTILAGGTVLGALAAGALVLGGMGPGGVDASALPEPIIDRGSQAGEPQVVVFSGGCFWGVQAVFQHVEGVLVATSGYAGGSAATATYSQVGTGRTGHAESVRVTYDPDRVTFGQLLRVFFSVVHDPTQLNRQGPDIGPEYRSAVWYTTDAQREATNAYIQQLTDAGTFSRPIATEVHPLQGFYPAEEYHQDYLIEHPRQPYIVMHDLPKLRALEREFPDLWREDPVGWRDPAAGASR